MPFDSSGNASVTRNIAVTGQTVLAEQVNVPFADIQSMLSQVLLRSGVAPMTGPLNMNGFSVGNVSDAVNLTDAVNLQQLRLSNPIGVIVDYAGSTAPESWVFCFGQALSRSSYAALFSVIGTTYGAGDGSSTFNVPDLRGRVAAGKDDMGGVSSNRLSAFANSKTLGGAFGSDVVALTTNEMPIHNHGITDPGHMHPTQNYRTSTGSINFGSSGGTLGDGSGTGSAVTNITVNNAGGGVPHNNAQPTIILNKIIRVSY